MSAPVRTVEEARARLERLGSRDPDALDALCRRLARGPLAVALLGATTSAIAALLFAWAQEPLFLLPLGLGALFAVEGARGLRAITLARRDFLREPRPPG